MKPFVKLLFVALLIAWAMSMPTKVKASGTTYTCGPGMGSCEGSAEEWMGECINWDCYNNGSPYNGCYGWFYETPSGSWAEESSCGEYVGGDCIQTCMDEMNNLINACYSANCS